MSSVIGYEVMGRVSTGAGAAVWKARDTRLNRTVALKEIADSAAAEARALAALSSDHVVAVYGVVADGSRTFLVEEWIDGATLREVLSSSGRLSTGQALGVMRGALLGLADVHRSGLVHGDVSAANILVDVAGVSRLIDFGSAVRVGERVSASTGAFAAPEVLAGASATAPADVFAAAGVLAMLLHGRTDVRPSTRGVDEPVRDVLDRALDADPQRRYPDAAQFLGALEDAAQRRYGAGWWTNAGLGALAGASSASLGLELADAPFTTTGSGAVAEPTRALPQVNPSGFGSRRVLLIASGVVAAGVVIAIAVALTSGDDKKSPARAQLPPAPGGSGPASTSAHVSATSSGEDFTGTYHLVEIVTATQGVRASDPAGKVGATFVRTWQVTTTCAGARCTAAVTSSSGGTLTFVQQGTTWRSVVTGAADCRSNDTGKLLGPTRHTVTSVLRPVAGPSGTPPQSYTGTAMETGPPAFTCPAVRIVGSLTLTRVDQPSPAPSSS